MCHVMQPVCDNGALEGSSEFLSALDTLYQILARLAHPCRHLDHGKDWLIQLLVATKTVHCLNEDINTLVAELITTAGTNDKSILGEFATCKTVCNLQELLASNLALALELCCLGHKVCFETIGEYSVTLLVHQFLALTAGNLTYCGEAVNTMRCLALQAVLGLNVQLLGHLGAVVCPQIVIKGLVVAGNATTDGCGMSSEDGCNLGYILLDIHCTKAGHPFVCLINHVLAGLCKRMTIETLNHQTCSI